MTKSKDCNFFLSIGENDIKFEAINTNNEIFFSKNNLINNSSNKRNFEILEKFLDNNILNIEKELSSYVENINLVVDHNDFLFVNLSMKYNFDGINFDLNHLNRSLIELKKYFQNTIGNFLCKNLTIFIIKQFFKKNIFFNFICFICFFGFLL